MGTDESIGFGHLYDLIIEDPIKSGCNSLQAVSGYSSGALVAALLSDYEDLKLDLIIGMAKASGIPAPDHQTYIKLTAAFPERFSCFYYAGKYPVHAKGYVWIKNDHPEFGIISSANLSWGGLRQYQELAVYTQPDFLLDTFSDLAKESLRVDSPDAENAVSIFVPQTDRRDIVKAAHGYTDNYQESREPLSVTLSLLTAKGEIHTRSGLNWGHRDNRNRDEAYIPIRSKVHKENPGFFPPPKQRFLMETDDGVLFTCVIAQERDKAIETPDGNNLLGEYFRDRLGLPRGIFVTKQHLENYGRTDVEITKIDQDLFTMDFSV